MIRSSSSPSMEFMDILRRNKSSGEIIGMLKTAINVELLLALLATAANNDCPADKPRDPKNKLAINHFKLSSGKSIWNARRKTKKLINESPNKYKQL